VIQNIVDGIVAALLEAFPGVRVYTEQIKQGLIEPCFIVRLVTPASERTLGERFKRTHLFSVQYIPASETAARAECYGVQDTLFHALEYIAVSGDLVRGTGMRGEVINDVLNFTVNYNLYVVTPVEATPMEELEQVEITTKG
jgi:hypothetical protein